MAAAEKELALERAVPSWFSVDTRSGDLTVCLDEKSAFAGLVRARTRTASAPRCAHRSRATVRARVALAARRRSRPRLGRRSCTRTTSG